MVDRKVSALAATQVCDTCKQEKPEDMFWWSFCRIGSGWENVCDSCEHSYWQAWSDGVVVPHAKE